jgi:hypothetical protein
MKKFRSEPKAEVFADKCREVSENDKFDFVVVPRYFHLKNSLRTKRSFVVEIYKFGHFIAYADRIENNDVRY